MSLDPLSLDPVPLDSLPHIRLHGAARRSAARRVLAVARRAAVIPCLMVAVTAHAGLGDAKAAATTDRAAIAAQSMSTTPMPGYDRTELTTVDGTSVREFSGRDGTVFAVDFSGPTMPDLKAVLGAQYDRYVAAARAHPGNHHAVSFASDDAVISIVKLPRGFSGHAYLPAAVPAGVDVRTLR